MKKLLLIGATLLLGGCVAVPYGGDPYYYNSGYYAAPAPVYVAPSVDIGVGYYRGWGGRGWGGRGWGGGWHHGH